MEETILKLIKEKGSFTIETRKKEEERIIKN
jgi:hypothetical protein